MLLKKNNFIEYVFLIALTILSSCSQNQEKIETSSIVVSSNEHVLTFKSCDCSPRIPTYVFLRDNGSEIEFDFENEPQYKYFICDKSFGNNSTINPYKNKKFKFVFDKAIEDPNKKIISMTLIDNMSEWYEFTECGNTNGGMYRLVFTGTNVEVRYKYQDYFEKATVQFVSNSSTDTSDYGSPIYGINNQESSTVFNVYNPESDGYDSYCLSSSSENKAKQIENKMKEMLDEKNTCTICGNLFSGKGYEEVSEGEWKECKEPYQCFVCSKACGLKHTRKLNNLINGASNNNIKSSNSYHKSSDGKIYESNACSLCKGTGIEKNTSSMSNEYGRKCPMCDGKGVRSY